MIQPPELKLIRPMTVGGKQKATTIEVWEILMGSHAGDLDKVKSLSKECPGLLYAQYNYAPPIHFAVREGHTQLVKYLLDQGAHDPAYRIYPFLDSLQTLALDRGYHEIAAMLDDYTEHGHVRFSGDNGAIDYGHTTLQKKFEKAVNQNRLADVRRILKDHPEFALDNTYFWSEGILLAPVKKGHFDMVDLLMSFGAKVPDLLKWAQFYYFETYAHAEMIMQRGMNPNVMSWQRVTLLHDMAQKGYIDKAKLLLKYGADINPVDEQYQSTPLGMAARWGHADMVKFLLDAGADPKKAGAPWAAPLAWAKSRGHEQIIRLLS